MNQKPLDLFENLFQEQREFLEDKAKYKTAICSRRAGKSYLFATALLHSALSYEETFNPYISLTRKSARRIMWPILKKLNSKYNLKGQFKEADLEIEFPNRSTIFLCGANDENVAETLRGNPYKLVCIDECASYRGHIEYLIDEVIDPALMDHAGTLCLAGTPSADFESYFYKATTGRLPGWSKHTWTMFDNPFTPNAREFVEELKVRRGWTSDNPILLREYYGLWTRSSDDLVYAFNPLKNVYTELPKGELYYIIGFDIGYNDATAFSVIGFNFEISPNVYLIESIKHNKVTQTEIQILLQGLVAKYTPINIVADTGALGKMIVEEMKQRTGLMIESAEKQGKMAYIELMNADFIDGKIKVDEEHLIIQEWNSLLKVKNAQGKLVEDPTEANDLADSFLYAYRYCKHYFFKEKPVPVKPGSAEFYALEEKKMFEQIMKNQVRIDDGFESY